MSTSKDGALLTTIRDLARRRGRERRGLALAEGVRLIEEAVAAAIPIRGAAVSPALEGTTRGKALKLALAGRGVRMVEVAPAELDALADTEHPQGVVAVVEPRVWSLADVPVLPGGVVLVLDAVQDPGNFGTLVRTAEALGAAGVIALPGTVDPWNAKSVRAAMGSSFRLPIVQAGWDEAAPWLAERGIAIVAAVVGAEPLPSPPPARAALVLGNEGAGVGDETLARAGLRAGIPLRGRAESLNVGAAGAILLHELLR